MGWETDKEHVTSNLNDLKTEQRKLSKRISDHSKECDWRDKKGELFLLSEKHEEAIKNCEDCIKELTKEFAELKANQDIHSLKIGILVTVLATLATIIANAIAKGWTTKTAFIFLMQWLV